MVIRRYPHDANIACQYTSQDEDTSNEQLTMIRLTMVIQV